MILPPVGWVRTRNSGGQAQGSTPAPSSIGKSQASGACAFASRILHNRPSRLTLHLHTWRAVISTPLLVVERTSPSQNRPLGGNPSTDALAIVSPNYRHGRRDGGEEAAVFCRLYAGVRTLGACKLRVEAECCQVPGKCPFARGQKTRHTEASGGHALQGSVCTVVCVHPPLTGRMFADRRWREHCEHACDGHTAHSSSTSRAHTHTRIQTRAHRSERCC